MKALVYHGINNLQLDDIDEPELESPTDAIIRIHICSICGYDIQIKQVGLLETGKVAGHEYCGVVTRVGEQVTRFKKGDRVMGNPFYNCGRCFWCEHQQPRLCANGATFGNGRTSGVLAEFARIPFADNTLKKIPEEINEEDGLLICNVLSVGNTGLIMGKVGIGDTVAIFGAGAVGLAAAMCTPLFGSSQVMVVDTVDYRLDFARKLGAIPINASSVDTVAAIKGLTDGRGVDVGIEAVGSADTFKQCVGATRKGGRVSVLGFFHQLAYFDITEDNREISSLSGGESHIDTLINMVRNDRIKPRSLITHRLPLSEIRHGYEIFEKKLENCIKIVFKC